MCSTNFGSQRCLIVISYPQIPFISVRSLVALITNNCPTRIVLKLFANLFEIQGVYIKKNIQLLEMGSRAQATYFIVSPRSILSGVGTIGNRKVSRSVKAVDGRIIKNKSSSVKWHTHDDFGRGYTISNPVVNCPVL